MSKSQADEYVVLIKRLNKRISLVDEKALKSLINHMNRGPDANTQRQ